MPHSNQCHEVNVVVTKRESSADLSPGTRYEWSERDSLKRCAFH